MNYKGKYKNTNQELFSLQTQIRAELNILRKTYEQVRSGCQRHAQRKHFPARAKETDDYQLSKSSAFGRSSSKSANQNRGKRRVSPILTPDKNSLSPCQKKHYPDKAKDNFKLKQRSRKSPSAYLIDRSKSPTPEKKNNLLEHKINISQEPIGRTSKKMAPEMHKFNKNFI